MIDRQYVPLNAQYSAAKRPLLAFTLVKVSLLQYPDLPIAKEQNPL
jgi:hypothetical protein